MNKRKLKYGKELRNGLLRLWHNDIDEIEEYLQFRSYNRELKCLKDIKRIVDDAFKIDELLIDQVDNILRNAKYDAVQEIFNRMNIKYLDTELVIDYLTDI